MQSLDTLLKQLGFDDVQAKLFSEIYLHGPTTVLELSKTTGIKRPTVHFHVEQLIAKRVVKEQVKMGRRVLVAGSLRDFLPTIYDQKEQLDKVEYSLLASIQESEELENKVSARFLSITSDDGEEAVLNTYKEALIYGEVYSYIDMNRARNLPELRMKLFDDVTLRQRLVSYSELIANTNSTAVEFIKKLSVFAPFQFTNSSIKLFGSAVNILVYSKTIATITYDTDWHVLWLTQPVQAQFIKELISSLLK